MWICRRILTSRLSRCVKHAALHFPPGVSKQTVTRCPPGMSNTLSRAALHCPLGQARANMQIFETDVVTLTNRQE